MQLIVNLHNIMFWIAVIIFLIASTLLSYSLIRFQRKVTGNAESEQGFRGNAVLEMIWTLIPVGILVVLIILTFQSL